MCYIKHLTVSRRRGVFLDTLRLSKAGNKLICHDSRLLYLVHWTGLSTSITRWRFRFWPWRVAMIFKPTSTYWFPTMPSWLWSRLNTCNWSLGLISQFDWSDVCIWSIGFPGRGSHPLDWLALHRVLRQHGRGSWFWGRGWRNGGEFGLLLSHWLRNWNLGLSGER